MVDRAADDFAAIAAHMREIAGLPDCECCDDTGWFDNRLGGISTSGWSECPECGNPNGIPPP